MKDVTIISQSRQKIGNVDVTFTVGRISHTPDTPATGASKASLNKDDREEKCRQLARLGAAMGRVVR